MRHLKHRAKRRAKQLKRQHKPLSGASLIRILEAMASAADDFAKDFMRSKGMNF